MNDRISDYSKEAQQYLQYLVFTFEEFWLEFKEKEYPNAKYFVCSFNQNVTETKYNNCFIVIYDFTTKSGVLTYISPNKYNKFNIINLTRGVEPGYLDETECYMIKANYNNLNASEFGYGEDEEVESYICKVFRYIKFINKGTDEEEYSQLISAVIGAANSIKNSKNEKEEIQKQKTITEMQTTIAELKASIPVSIPTYPWQEYYEGYTERVGESTNSMYNIMNYAFYIVKSESTSMNITTTKITFGFSYNYFGTTNDYL